MTGPEPRPTPDDPATPDDSPAAAAKGRPAILNRPSWPEAQAVAEALRTETIGGALLLVGRASPPSSWPTPRGREAYFRPARHRGRHRVGPPRPHARAVGRRRPARRSSSSSPGSSSSASSSSATCARRPRRWSRSSRPSAASSSRRWSSSPRSRAGRRGRRPARVGDPHGHRHRLRPRGARRHRLAPALGPALLPADPRGRRRPHRDHDHRDLLHLRPRGRAAAAGAGAAGPVRGPRPSGASPYWWLLLPLAFATWGLVHASGVHATVAGVLLGLVVPVKPRASVPVDQHPRPRRPTSPTGSSTGCGRCRPASPCPSSRSSPRASRSSAAASRAAADRRRRLGVVAGLVIGKVVGVFGST